MSGNFVNDRHALFAGWVMGTLMKRGYRVSPVTDLDGAYLARVRFYEDDPAHSFELTIPEPPEKWTLV